MVGLDFAVELESMRATCPDRVAAELAGVPGLTAAGQHDYSGSLAGERLLLVPTVMSWPGVRKMIAPCQPQLAYPPAASPPCGRAGHRQPRTALLTALAGPSSTTGLAGRLQITPGAVSQHLSALRDAGMVTCSRAGRQVLCRRTRTGDTLAASH